MRLSNTQDIKDDSIALIGELSRVYPSINGTPIYACKLAQIVAVHERLYRKQEGLPPKKSKKKSKKYDDVPWYQG